MSRDDRRLEAAVALGIISAEQLDAIRAIAPARDPPARDASTRDAPAPDADGPKPVAVFATPRRYAPGSSPTLPQHLLRALTKPFAMPLQKSAGTRRALTINAAPGRFFIRSRRRLRRCIAV